MAGIRPLSRLFITASRQGDNMIEMYHGKGTIKVLPQKVEEMKEKGWTLEKPSKPKLKKEVVSDK